MHAFKAFSITLALGMMGSASLAEEWHGALLEHEIGVDVPAGFVATPSFTNSNAESAIVEFQLPGETQDQWTQMFTVTAYADPSGQPAMDAAGAMAANLAQGYAGVCPDSFAAQDLGSPAIAGAEAVLVGWLSCGDTGGGATAESMIVLVTVKEGTIFTVQWAERGPANSFALGFDQAIWMPRIEALMTFSL